MARLLLVSALLAGVATSVSAQQAPVNRANWALADRYTNDALQPMIYTSTVTPRFIGKSDSLWYFFKDRNGGRFLLVVPATKAKQPLFDHQKLASALTAGGKPYVASALPFTALTIPDDDHRKFTFLIDSTKYEWDMRTEALKRIGVLNRQELARYRAAEGGGGGGRQGGGGGGRQGGAGGPNQDFRAFSPDSTAYVYALNHNLYIVETKGDTTPKQISRDGVVNYSFGARDTTEVDDEAFLLDEEQQNDNMWDNTLLDPVRQAALEELRLLQQQQQQQRRGPRELRVRAQVVWSPDSKAFAVQRTDQRLVKDLYLVNSLGTGRPSLSQYRYAMPGEDTVPQREVHVYKRGDAQLAKLSLDHYKDQSFFDIHFPVNSDKLRLVRRDRLQRNMQLIEVDVASKQTRALLRESTDNAFLERQNVRYVKAGGDFIWWSERSGWGHYYLYDHNGTLKNAITRGDWRAESIAELDSINRILYVRGVGREPGETPYYTHLYRVGLDGTAIALLDAGDATHNSTLSPSKRFLVDGYSRTDLVPRSVLREALTGKVILDLETMDISKLQEYGFRLPERFVVKAADGVTDIYGNMWKPLDFDSTKKYPVVANVYPGPQTEQVTYTFTANGVQQRLAQLGILVIQIGNRGGSPQRANAYHSYGYYNLRDYGLADKKAGIEQLAARFSYVDIKRVGMFGHSGGGFMTAAALLQAPYNEFFKVGVSSAGNHDNNVYNLNWSEQHHGLKQIRTPKKGTVVAAAPQDGQNAPQAAPTQVKASGEAKPTSGEVKPSGEVKSSADDEGDANYDIKWEIKVPSNAELAGNLKGRLLLVHGDMDNNVHYAGTYRLAEALIKANKRFDFMTMPGKPHGFGDMQPYFTRMLMEYFAEHLIGDYYRGDAEMRGKN